MPPTQPPEPAPARPSADANAAEFAGSREDAGAAESAGSREDAGAAEFAGSREDAGAAESAAKCDDAGAAESAAKGDAGPRFARLSPVAWLALLVAVALPNLARFGNGLTLDDEPLLTAGVISSWANLPRALVENAMYAAGKDGGAIDTYRPLSIATFFWDYAVSGLDTWSYHLSNLTAHLLATVAAVWLAARLAPAARTTSLLVAGLFVGLHPAGAEAHVWINGRSDVWMTAVGLLSLAALVVARDPRTSPRGRVLAWAAVPALTLAACLFKETWTLLLLAYPLVDRIAARHRDPASPAHRPRSVVAPLVAPVVAPLVGVAAYAVLRWAVLGGARAGGSSTLREAAPHLGLVWMDGLRTLLAPTRVSMRVLRDDYAGLGEPAFAAAFLGVALVLAALAVFTARVRRVHPVHLALVSLGASLLPIPLLAVSGWPGFHRYLYAAIALTAPLAACVFHRVPRRGLRAALLGALLLAFSVQTLRVTAVYRDMTSFAQAILDENPRVPLAWDVLGQRAMEEGDPHLAADCFERALQAGPPTCPLLERASLAWLLRGRPEIAARLADRTIEDPACPVTPGLLNVSAMAWMHANPERAVERALACLTLDPGSAECAANLHRWCTDHPYVEAFRGAFRAAVARPDAAPGLAQRVPACGVAPSGPPAPTP